MTTETRRTPLKPHAFLAAFGLALASFLSPANAAAQVACQTYQTVCLSGCDHLTIQNAVSAISTSPLSGNWCIDITDNATYNEQVTITSRPTGGFRIYIGTTTGASSPTITPPGASTAAFRIANASVSIQGLNVVINQNTPYGIWASSAFVNLSNISVSTAGSLGIYTAGVRLSSNSSVSYSSITAWNAHGLWLDGSVYSSVSSSTIVSKSSVSYGLYLLGADSNTVTGSFFQNDEGSAVRLDGGSDYNALSYSGLTSNRLSFYSLYFNASDDNTATGLKIENPNGNGIAFWTGADRNTVSLSTVVSNGNGQGIAYVGSDWNILTNSYVQNLAAWGVYLQNGADNNAVSFSTVIVDSAVRYALYINTSASNTVTQSVLSNPSGDAARLEYAHYNTISQSAMTSAAGGRSALYLTVSSFNVITGSYISNPSGYGAQLLDAGRNTITQSSLQSSTSTAQALKITATAPGKAVFNLISECDVYNPAGHAGTISFSANNNDVYRSTFTSFSNIHRALEINSVSSTTVTQTYMANSTGYGMSIAFSTGVSINGSKMESSSGFGLYVDVSSGVKMNGSKAQGNPAVYVRSSSQTVVSGELNTFGGGKGLWIDNGNVGVSASFLTIFGAGATEGINLAGPNIGPLSFSSVTIAGPNVGFSIAPQAAGAALSVASMTFQGLSAGATAIQFVGGGTFVSTFSGVYFADSSIGANVSAAALSGGSRITMLVASGMRGGSAFENDPAGVVDWPNFGIGGITAAPFTAVTNVALTANWNSSFPGGTNYTAELSTGGFPNNFLGNQSFVTANLYQIFSGLNSGTPYFARVSTNPANGPFTLLGSTVTSGGSGAGTITPLSYTNVSANSLTANWNTTFGGGTVYNLRISTNAFATVNSVSTTTNVSFFFGGLLPSTSYEVRVSTVGNGIPFTGLGVTTTPASGGGTAVNFNFNNAAQGAVIASANGQNETGLGIVADPVPGGDVYVIFASTPGATGARNKAGHDTAGVVGIVRYGSDGAALSSRTLASDTRGDLVRDDAAYVYVAETDRSQGAPMRINKYTPDLGFMVNSVSIPMPGEFGAMISTGTSIFALVENTSDNTARIMQYDPNLVAVATAAFYSIGGLPVKGHGMAREKNVGFLYVLVSTAGPSAPVHVLRYPSNSPGAFNGATPLDITIPDVTSQQNPRIAVSGDKLYIAFTDPSAQNIITRQYSGSIGYTGFSAMMTNVAAPFGKPVPAIQADDVNVYVGGTVNAGGGGDYLVTKLDPNNGLAFVSSGSFNSSTYLADQLTALAIGAPGEILVTGASSNTISDANALTTGLYMGVGGGQGGAISSAPYTNVSTSSFIANWYTSFPNGTVYYLELSTNAFSTVVTSPTTGANYFVFGGLATNTSYSVRLSTTGSGPYTPLGAVSTLGDGVAITGTLSYAGVEPGMIRVEAFTSPSYAGLPVSSQILSAAPSQPYYLPVGAGTFYVRAYVDVFGGGSYRSWLDQGTTGPFTLSASSLTGRNFTISVDSIAPNSPLGLYATPSGGQVYLSWSAPTTSTNGAALQDLRGYIIRR
ncbi:MAG: right-handed parallel beta-helix repeat-containing protein, partial [Elusimicrobia bacterium]|nr:right-handed parallel beta-helix repeat-containing protein [Elusimicrobiota bacterium]